MNHETSKIYFLNKDSAILDTSEGNRNNFLTSETYEMISERNKMK